MIKQTILFRIGKTDIENVLGPNLHFHFLLSRIYVFSIHIQFSSLVMRRRPVVFMQNRMLNKN